MRLPERLLYEPQHLKEEKVTEKALTRSIVVSVIGILFCMTCLFGLTWAWFSDSIVTSSNKITAASFDLNITVTEQGTKSAVTVDDEGYYILDAEKKYTVSLAKLGTAKTGFCQLLVITPTAETETATPYYTDSIPQIDEATETEPFIFTLLGVSKIKFTAMWGQCPEDPADRVVHYGDTLSLGTAAKVEQEETESKEPELEPEPEEDSSAKAAAPSATEPQQTESTAGAETAKIPETTGTPETTQAEPSETEGGEGETPSETPSGSETPTE